VTVGFVLTLSVTLTCQPSFVAVGPDAYTRTLELLTDRLYPPPSTFFPDVHSIVTVWSPDIVVADDVRLS
jgi:hypothetical protein